MKTLNTLFIAVFALLLTGCGSDPEPAPESKSDAQPKTEAVEVKEDVQTEVLQPAMETLDKAKAVEQQLIDAEAELKTKIDEQEDALKMKLDEQKALLEKKVEEVEDPDGDN